MFTCYYCGKTTKPKEEPTTIITEMRKRIYSCGSEGWEIVKEKSACPSCVKRLNKMDALATLSEVDSTDLLSDGEPKELMIPIKTGR